MRVLKQFFKNRETYIGLTTALLFLLIFFCVWMTAYDGVTERTNELRIGLINEDEVFGTSIEENIKNNIPFKVKTYSSLQTAKDEMNNRQIDMVMHIPKGFSEDIQLNGKTEIIYFINQANTSLAKQIMENTTDKISESINENVYIYKQQLVMQQSTDALKSIIPSEELFINVSANFTQALHSLNLHSVKSSIQKVNDVEGFAVTMVPLMIVLASFVGSMILSMNINLVAMRLNSTFGKWSLFFARQIINLGVAISLAIITMVLLFLFNIELSTTLIQTWLFQATVFFAFISLTQTFVILFGTGGMVFNIILLSLQLVTSGAIVPRVMLSNFYQTLGSYLPATYAVDGYFTITYGGNNLVFNTSILLLISALAISLAALRVLFQRNVIVQVSETLPV